MNGLKNWITIAALAVAPVTFAQGTRTMEEAKASTVEVALAATPVQARDDQRIDDLRMEIEALRGEVNSQQQREDRSRELVGDPESHPLWP